METHPPGVGEPGIKLVFNVLQGLDRTATERTLLQQILHHWLGISLSEQNETADRCLFTEKQLEITPGATPGRSPLALWKMDKGDRESRADRTMGSPVDSRTSVGVWSVGPD